MKDNSLTASVALPNAANTVNTNSLDLKQQAVRPFVGGFRVKLTASAATAANSKNINFSLQGSNESGANFTNIPGLGVITQTGNASAHPAKSQEFILPPNTDVRYIRGSATGEANGGDASDGTLTCEVII